MFITTKNLTLNSKDKEDAFGNFLDAGREGHHFIWVPKADLQNLIKEYPGLPFLSNRQRETFENLYHNVGDDGHQYMLLLNAILTIDFEEESILTTEIKVGNTNNQINYISGYKKYLNSSALRETILITENLDDALFYLEIGEIYKESNSMFKQLKLTSQNLAGGGDNTHQTFTESSKSLQPLLCILDSDKIHPRQSEVGETAKKVLHAKKQLNGIETTLIRPLPVRAIENLMPTSVLKEIKEEGHYLGLVFEEENKKFKKYVKCKDFKGIHGKFITLEDLEKKLCVCSKQGFFWSEFYEKYQYHSEQLVCSNLHHNLKFGKKVGFIASCINILKNNISIRNSLFSDETETDLKNIALDIISWAISYPLAKD